MGPQPVCQLTWVCVWTPKGRVTLVAPYSSAEKAGIKINDMLLLFDGRKVANGEELDYHAARHSARQRSDFADCGAATRS